VRNYGVLHTGVAFLPQTLTLAALSFGVTARLVNRFGSLPPLLVGLAACAGGLALLATVGATPATPPDCCRRSSSSASAPASPSCRC
jgi:hypothetical protein